MEVLIFKIKLYYDQRGHPDSTSIVVMSVETEIVEGTEVEALFRQAELATMTMEQRISYETSIMSRNDMLNSMREAVEAAKEEAEKLGRAIGEAEGREIGIAEGREEGREEVMVTAVNKLLKNGVSIEIIADSLGITIDKAKGYII